MGNEGPRPLNKRRASTVFIRCHQVFPSDILVTAIKEEVIDVVPSQKNWVLLALRNGPLDRIHLMKVLFLLWIRANRQISGYFVFEPYLYGAFSLDSYSALADVQREGLVVQPPHPIHDWAPHHLTDKGKLVAGEAAQLVDTHLLALLETITAEIVPLNFYDLLRKVYREAPEFAARSLIREIVEA